MKTKTPLLAVLAIASVTSLKAQTNVFSENVVGYVNVVVPANAFDLIANQLNTTNNSIKNVIPNPRPGTIFYKYNGGYSVYAFDGDDLAWTPNGDVTLSPGEGGFVRNFENTPMTLTFVGEVLQGSLTNPIPQGFSIRSSMAPIAGGISQIIGYPPAPGDIFYRYGGGYTTYTFDADDLVWGPSEPVIDVGEAFFIHRFSPSFIWVRNFTVP